MSEATMGVRIARRGRATPAPTAPTVAAASPAPPVAVPLGEDLSLGLSQCAAGLHVTVENVVRAAWTILLDALGTGPHVDPATSPAELATALHGRGTAGPVEHGGLRLALAARPGGPITVMLLDSGRRLDDDALAQLGDCLRCVLEAMVVGPDQPICRIEVLGDEERSRIFGVRPEPPIFDLTVPGLIADHVTRSPDAVAIVEDDTPLSYAELDELTDRLACRLIERGAGPDRWVALDLARPIDVVAGLLATLKIGTVCLPAGPRTAPGGRAVLVLSDLDDLDRCRHSDHRWTPSALSPANVDGLGAYVLHGDLVERLLSRQAKLGIAPGSRHLADGDSPWDVFGPLIVGATVLLRGPGGKFRTPT